MQFKPPFNIGDHVEAEGGFFGGAFLFPGDKIYGAIWAPKEEGETIGILLPNYQMVPGATSCYDSMANTIALAEAGSPLSIWARGLRIGGKDDWAIPARDIVEVAYRHLKPTTQETYCSFRDGDNATSIPVGYPYTEAQPIVQTTVEAFKHGGPEAFQDRYYTTSTQYSSDGAYVQYFDNGYQDSHCVTSERPARAVRMILLNP